MPTLTPRLLLPRPVDGDYMTRANMMALIDAIDTNAARQTDFGPHVHAHTALTGIDTDASAAALHHTLGLGATQAAVGSPTHVGLTPGPHGTVHAAAGGDPLPDNAITTPKITDAHVTTVKLANGAATGVKLGADVLVVGTDQSITSRKTFSTDLELAQIAMPAAPAAGWTRLYAKLDGNVWRRTAAGEFPLGGAKEGILPALAWLTDQTPGTWAEQLPADLSGRNWVLSFAKGEKVEGGVQVPFGYFGLPITAYVSWYCAATTGNVLWRLQTANTAPGGNLAAGFATRFSDATDPVVATANLLNQATLTWTTNLPAPGDWLQLRLLRPNEAGDTAAGEVLVLSVSIIFG